jgi:hypothetical protein
MCANFIFKLHTAALNAPTKGVTLYPVMDGFYASSADKGGMLDFLRSVFQQVAREFNREKAEHYRFLIKGALAFGPVIHGSTVPAEASKTIAKFPSYRDSLLLGLPMVQAHIGERSAPPFGVFVHESARSFSSPGQTPIHNVWWKWKDKKNDPTWTDLEKNLIGHLEWCLERAGEIEYAPDRIQAHREMVQQYFAQ